MLTDKLQEIEEKYDQVTKDMADPANLSNHSVYRQLGKERNRLEPLAIKAKQYRNLEKEIQETKNMLEDEEFKEMAKEELTGLKKKQMILEQNLTAMILAESEEDENRDIIMEIRAGTGGDESTLFAADMFRMYTKYAQSQGWKPEIMNSNPTGIGGFKEIIFALEGEGAYGKLKFESGVHRVQRVPATESSGRIHTSAVTVAVLPEMDDVEVDMSPNDLRVDVFRSSGPGGQSVNTTDSAVRITHLPTGLVVTCQDEKSQHKNKAKALRVLKARLQARAKEEQDSQIAEDRRRQVGSGDRSEKIRTYNFPQNRVTDHRIGLTLHKLETIMEGEVEEIISALRANEQAERLKKAS